MFDVFSIDFVVFGNFIFHICLFDVSVAILLFLYLIVEMLSNLNRSLRL